MFMSDYPGSYTNHYAIETEKVRLTPEGGIAVKLTNRTGSASVKGSIVSASTQYNNAFKLQDDTYDALGVVYETGIANGSECWVIQSGIAEILLEDSSTSDRGNWVKASTQVGRALANSSEPAQGVISATSEHFKEIGHCILASTGGLSKAVLHFN